MYLLELIDMKVALITFHSFFREGGVKRHVLSLQKEFKKKGVKSKIIVPRRKRREDYSPDILFLGTSFPVSFAGTQGDFCISLTPFSIEKILKKENFNVLHFHNFVLPLAAQILERSSSLNILTFHANLEKSKFLEKSFKLISPLILKKIDGILGVAPFVLKYFEKFKCPKKVIPNGIDLEEFNPKVPKIKRFSDSKINILFLGRIEERKGLIYLLKAYKILEKKFSNLRLIIVGEGILKEKYEKWVKENNLKEVYFEGEKRGKEVPSYYVSSDIFVSPAIFGESFGLVLLEAMASGVPVVAFSNLGYREFLKGKKGAFLVPNKNYKALSKKIEILIKDEKLRKKMGLWGREEAKNYCWSKIVEQILDFYKFCQKRKRFLNKI